MPDLYRMYNRRGELLYVGISGNAAARASQHGATKPWWPDVARITIDHLDCDWTTALGYEKRAIINEKPTHNIQHNNTDEYIERIEVKPFEIPYDLIDTPEWAAVRKAIIDLRHYAYRRYGLPNLIDRYTYEAPYGRGTRQITIDFLSLLEATARAAHLSVPCRGCGNEIAPTTIRIKERRNQLEDTLLQVFAECRDCYAATTVREINWENA